MTESNKIAVKDEIEKLGYKVVYVPHDVIKDYNACYRVKYNSILIFPPAADKLGIPLNEIWISEKWKVFDEYLLYHELAEIKFRASGYSVNQAHELAIKETEEKFKGEPKFELLRREINIATKETFAELGIADELSQKIVDNRPYQYMDELVVKIPTLGNEIFMKIKEHFWCVGDSA